MSARLDQQFAFLIETDALKRVDRSNLLLDNSRPENSAEHSWHIALWALVFEDELGTGAALDLHRILSMLVLHDIVEIDAGDHPIHLDSTGQTQAETEAAARLFGLLPPDQARSLRGLWEEFEAGQSPDAIAAKTLDHAQPLFQVLCAHDPLDEHVQIARDNLQSGRASDLGTRWPQADDVARGMLDGTPPQAGAFQQRLAFLSEADRLKSVLRASRLIDNSRFENSAEHSWHILLHALVLAEYAAAEVDIARVLKMLLIHDLVEIDAGDAPIHGDFDAAAMALKEEAAAERLFGLLPSEQGRALRALWHEFEAATTPDAVFAKAIDRVQTPVANMENNGGSWPEYNVTRAQLETRVGTPVGRGAPEVWRWLARKLDLWFA